MNAFSWLIRRELWEHRSFLYVPLIVGSLMVLMTLLFSGDIIEALRLSGEKVSALSDEERGAAFGAVVGIFAGTVAVFMLFVVLVYLLDCLHAERADRSILFWKSLPISDAETVLSKLAMAMVVAPLIVLVCALGFGLAEMLILSVDFAVAGLNPWQSLWASSDLFGTIGFLIYAVTVQALWHFPLFAWLLLVSAFAKRGVWLWAFLPPFAIVFVEDYLFGSRWFAEQLGERITGVFLLAFRHVPGHQVVISEDDAEIKIGTRLADLIDPGPFLASPGLWIGLIVGAALIAAAIWLRRYRDESL